MAGEDDVEPAIVVDVDDFGIAGPLEVIDR